MLIKSLKLKVICNSNIYKLMSKKWMKRDNLEENDNEEGNFEDNENK